MPVMRRPLDTEIRRPARVSPHEHGDDASHQLDADRQPGFVDKLFPRYILGMNLQAAADLAKPSADVYEQGRRRDEGARDKLRPWP